MFRITEFAAAYFVWPTLDEETEWLRIKIIHDKHYHTYEDKRDAEIALLCFMFMYYYSE